MVLLLAAGRPAAQAAALGAELLQSSSDLPIGNGLTIVDDALAAQTMTSADLDGDGDNDLISASRVDGSVRWYRNLGGQYPQLTPIYIDHVDGAYAVVAADLNRDGAMDILVTGIGLSVDGTVYDGESLDAIVAGTSRFVWYRNNGEANPAFTRIQIDDGLGYPVAIDAADLDGDGDADLLLALRGADKVVWYENLGGPNPSFAYHELTNQTDGAAAVKAGDLDLDGDLDVVIAAENTDTIAWFENQGGLPLRFAPRVIRTASRLPSPELDFSRTVDLADVDGDGNLDVVYGSDEDGEIGWYENTGGSGPQFLLHVVSTAVPHVKFVSAADVDSDGDVDLMAAADQTVMLFENDGGAPPSFGQQELAPAAAGARFVSTADVNSDGLLDLLSASQDDNRIVWYPNLMVHRSAYYAPQTRAVVAVGRQARMAYSGDLDSDGDTDIVSIFGDQIRWHQNDGMQPPTFQEYIVDPAADGGRWVHVADMDSDGDLDIISAATADNRVAWHENNGGATPAFTTRVISDSANGARAALAADLDGDGDQDVYSASHGDNKIAWYENLDGRGGRFAEHVVSTEAMYARSVYAADLDGDGDLDLMSASQIDDEINWYRNNGGPSPSFTPYTVGYVDGAQHVYATDVDGDGDVDILAASEFDHTISLYENNGAPQPEFAWRPIDQTANGVHAVYGDDLDGDGDIDLVAAIEKLNAFKWYENNGQQPAQFTPRLVYDRALAAHGVHADDIDGDGDSDLIGISRDDGVVAWFENRGGNYAVGVEQNNSDVNASGQFAELARILVAHRGRPGDANIELHSLEFTFWNGDGSQLNDESFQRWVESVAIYRDTQDGRFDPGQDQLLVHLTAPALNSNQRLVAPMPAESGQTQIAPGQTHLLFLVVEMTDACVTSADELSVSMVLTSRTARDALFKAPMLAESLAGVADDGGADDEPDATDPLHQRVHGQQ